MNLFINNTLVSVRTTDAIEASTPTMDFNMRVVEAGAKYGLDDCKTNDDSEPLVEFYDAKYPHTKYGQFVARYYALTLLKGTNDGLLGFCLDMGIPAWSLNRHQYWLAIDELQSVVKS